MWPPYDPHALIFLITTQTHLHFSCSHSSLPLLAISILLKTILTHHLMHPTWCRLTLYTFLELMKKRCNACENSPSRCTLNPFALSSTPIFFLLFTLASLLPPTCYCLSVLSHLCFLLNSFFVFLSSSFSLYESSRSYFVIVCYSLYINELSSSQLFLNSGLYNDIYNVKSHKSEVISGA